MKIGLIGCGRAARQHIDAIQNLPGVQIVALCDVDDALASELEVETGVEKQDYSEIIQSSSIDAVSICTPPGKHFSMAIDALNGGKAVLVEKPITLCLNELEEILNIASKFQLPVAVMHQHRFRVTPNIRRNWSSKTSATVELFRYRPESHFIESNWRTKISLSGGGVFTHVGIHYADLVCQLLGEPSEVLGYVDCMYSPHIDTRVALAVRFCSGAVLTLLADTMADRYSDRLRLIDGNYDLTITGEKTLYQEDGVLEQVESPNTSELRAAVYQEFAEAVSGKSTLRTSAASSTKNTTKFLELVRAQLEEANSY